MAGNSFMIFCATCSGTMKTALMLRNLGISAIPLNGQMSQNKRLAALTKFKAKARAVLISTDVASRYVLLEIGLMSGKTTTFRFPLW